MPKLRNSSEGWAARERLLVTDAVRRTAFLARHQNKDLVSNADGTTTIYVQADAPTDPSQRANWLPSPKGKPFSLYVRTYWPDTAILDGTWSPPKVEPMQ